VEVLLLLLLLGVEEARLPAVGGQRGVAAAQLAEAKVVALPAAVVAEG
jgi:hypothetical protein